METDDELAKSHFSRFPNDYLCIRCGHEIYVGAKLIYEGIDPGLFNRIESAHCYGPDDGPFLFRGNPVVPARPGVPSHQDLEAVGYQFPSRGRYPNHRGVGPRRGMGPRGRGPYGYGGHQPRMVMPPNQGHEEWSTLSHQAGILRCLLHRRGDFRGNLQLERMVTLGIMSLNLGEEQNPPKFRTWCGPESKGSPVYQSKQLLVLGGKTAITRLHLSRMPNQEGRKN
ncbi:hypothetical protein RHGRI_027440 [Rhododendron griersonianum]|uniref:Uncharacterized protein n=1 Tax=Rhododendron griersonianum TaxID=479676 RepID=A0AAV6J3D2_9ERIC|nr:hypothetical protein RHGRI_027440 [Rhododendron griersonianum]